MIFAFPIWEQWIIKHCILEKRNVDFILNLTINMDKDVKSTRFNYGRIYDNGQGGGGRSMVHELKIKCIHDMMGSANLMWGVFIIG